MNFSEKIKSILENVGISQRQLAEEINVTQSTISSWINGQTPYTRGIQNLAMRFNLPIKTLKDDSISKEEFESELNQNYLITPSEKQIDDIIENSFTAEDVISSIENLYSLDYDSNTIDLLKAVNQMYEDYVPAIDYLKKNDNMALATILTLFDKLHRTTKTASDSTGKIYHSGIEKDV